MTDLYTAENVISKTGLDYIGISPLDYWWRYLNPEREPYVKSKDVIFDEALRMAIIDFPKFNMLYAKQPATDRRTSLGKMEYENFITSVEKNGYTPLTAVQHETIISMRETALNHPTAKIILSDGKPGEPLRFEEINTGAIIGFCPHWIHKGNMIVNISSTEDAGAQNFAKEAANFKLHKKAALQLDGSGASVFVFLMIEKTAPFKLQVHFLDDRSIDLGRAQYVKNAQVYMECLASGKWPGLPEKIASVGLPEWAFKNY